jgi:tetratricopeptide (TPR) repeat protein
MQQAGQYLGRGQYPEALGLLRACREDFPQFVSTYAMLARAYLGTGDIAAAEAVLQASESVEALFPWEPAQIEQARTAIRKAKMGSAAEIVGQALASGGIPAAEKILAELLIRRDAGPVFEESDFNGLGYRLLQEGNLDMALYVFEKNAALYPDSWNAHDSRGEALMQAGRREQAIESYRRSLELNPKNRNGREMLERLESGR